MGAVLPFPPPRPDRPGLSQGRAWRSTERSRLQPQIYRPFRQSLMHALHPHWMIPRINPYGQR